MDDQHDLSDPLIVGTLRLEVQATPSGAMLAATNRATQPLTYVIDAAFGGVMDGLQEDLLAERSLWMHGMFAMRRADVEGPVPPEAEADWKELSGQDPVEDSYLLGAEFLDTTLMVPRAVLLDLISQLSALRGAGG
jgi:hypothetical protein